MLRRVLTAAAAGLAVLALSFLALGLTADEILDRVEEETDLLARGSLVATIQFDNVYADGTTAGNVFGSLSKPNLSLIYFVEPEDVAGTIFLTHDAVGEADARLWLYLPLLGIPKELVSDEERGGSFAGSSLSYEDLSEADRRKDYDARLVREETLAVGERSRPAYVIESTAKPGVDVTTPRTVVWIDKEFYTMLKMEGYNDLGRLESTMEVLSLTEFEGRLTADVMAATNVSEGSSTTITFIDRHRPGGEIPDSVFAPETLTTFDPSVWGF